MGCRSQGTRSQGTEYRGTGIPLKIRKGRTKDDIVTIQRIGSDSKAQLAISEENGEIVLYNKNKRDEGIVKKP